MTKKPKKYIELDFAKVREIADIKGISVPTVYAALNYKTHSSLAMLVRAWALNHGGLIYEAQGCCCCEAMIGIAKTTQAAKADNTARADDTN